MRMKTSLRLLLSSLIASALPFSALAAGEQPKVGPPDQHLVEPVYADDDLPATKSFHTVYTQWLSESASGFQRHVYDWAHQGGQSPDPKAREKAEKCLVIFKTLREPEKLPENPNLVVTLRCFEAGRWMEKRFDVNALPPDLMKLTEVMFGGEMIFPTARKKQEKSGPAKQ